MPTISSSLVQPLVSSFDGVIDQGASQAMDGSLRVVFADGHQGSILLLDSDAGGSWVSSLPFGPCTATVLP